MLVYYWFQGVAGHHQRVPAKWCLLGFDDPQPHRRRAGAYTVVPDAAQVEAADRRLQEFIVKAHREELHVPGKGPSSRSGFSRDPNAAVSGKLIACALVRDDGEDHPGVQQAKMPHVRLILKP